MSRTSAYYTEQATWLSRLYTELESEAQDPYWREKERTRYHLVGATAQLGKISNAMARREAARPNWAKEENLKE